MGELIRYLLSVFAPTYYSLPQMSNGLGIMQVFVLGMLLMHTIKEREKIALLPVVAYLVFCILLKVVLGNINELFNYDYICWMVPPYSLLFCYVLIILRRIKLLTSINPVLSWFGTYSLEIYIIHSIIYHFIRDNSGWSISPALQISISIAIALIVCQPVHVLINKEILNR